MIERVRTVGFKGFDIDEEVPHKVIYTGRNKSGKSTRAGAIAIAIYGHIPFSTSGKRPGDILDSYGNDFLVASVTINGMEFARKFSRNSKGGVSQSVQIDKKRTSTENFAIMLNKAGAPKIADVAEFMKQSEAKKIDTLFDLFPNPELVTIDNEIEDAKADVSRLEKKKSGVESTVVRLTNSKNEIAVPPGNIAEVQAEIKNVETQISDLQEQIKAAEIQEAEIKAKADGERQERERAKKEEKLNIVITGQTGLAIEEHLMFDPEKQVEQQPVENKFDPIDEKITRMEQQLNDYRKAGEIPLHAGGTYIPVSPQTEILDFQKSKVKQSILRIIGALQETGCETCAALIIAKQELKKYE